jgi:hypothetical protein
MKVSASVSCVDDQQGLPYTDRAQATEIAGAMPVGSKLTVLLHYASTIQVEAGFAEPKIVKSWYGDD